MNEQQKEILINKVPEADETFIEILEYVLFFPYDKKKWKKSISNKSLTKELIHKTIEKDSNLQPFDNWSDYIFWAGVDDERLKVAIKYVKLLDHFYNKFLQLPGNKDLIEKIDNSLLKIILVIMNSFEDPFRIYDDFKKIIKTIYLNSKTIEDSEDLISKYRTIVLKREYVTLGVLQDDFISVDDVLLTYTISNGYKLDIYTEALEGVEVYKEKSIFENASISESDLFQLLGFEEIS